MAAEAAFSNWRGADWETRFDLFVSVIDGLDEIRRAHDSHAMASIPVRAPAQTACMGPVTDS